MSKLKRLLGVLSIVSLFTFSSCVDDTVSPEVTALRNAQVALLNANTAVEQAEAALTAAITQSITIQNTFESANNAILLQLAAMDVTLKQTEVDAALAQLEVTLIKVQADLATEAKAAAEAADDLEVYLATAGLTKAQEYLNDWRAIMFGGFVTADGEGTNSIVSLREEIAGLETEIAIDKVFASQMDDDDDLEKRAFVTANLEAAIAEAQTDIDTRTARLATVNALLAGDFADPAAAQKAQLIELAEEKQTLENEIADLQDEVDAILASAEEADEIIRRFKGLPAVAVDAPLAVEVADDAIQGGKEYLQAIDDEEEADEAIEDNQDILDAWDDYAASLQAIYDEYHPFVAEAETEIAALEATIDAAEAAGEGGATLAQIRDNEKAFRAATTAEILMKVKRANGNAATADTTSYLAARAAYDGLSTRDQLFAAAAIPGGERAIIFDRTLTDYDDDASDYEDYYTLASSTTNRSGNADDEVGGTLGVVKKAEAGTTTDVLAEKIELVQLEDGFADAIAELAKLKKFIADVTSRKLNSTDNYSNVAGDLADSDQFEDYYVAIDDANEDIEFDVTPKGATDAIKAATEDKADAAAEKAKWAPFVAPYLEAYEAALEVDQDQLDSLSIAPRFEIYGKQLQLTAIEATIADVKADIERANQAVSVFELNDDNDAVVVNLRTAYLAEKDKLEDDADEEGSIKGAEAAFRAATNALEAHLINEMEVDALIASKEAELAALKVELTVLEALLAEYQALVLAAIGG